MPPDSRQGFDIYFSAVIHSSCDSDPPHVYTVSLLTLREIAGSGPGGKVGGGGGGGERGKKNEKKKKNERGVQLHKKAPCAG